MKNSLIYFRKNRIAVHLIAIVMVVCMGVADASLYLRYASEINDDAGIVRKVTEEHELEPMLADGYFGGKNSDSENGAGEPVDTADGVPMFNILEIVPTVKKGVVGYTIGGCEPFDEAVGLKTDTGKYLVTPQQMRTAYMDAFINPNPGSSNAKSWDYYNVNIGMLNSKLSEGGYWTRNSNGEIINDSDLWKVNESERKYHEPLKPFEFEPVDANGYYLKVGEPYGVYAKGSVVNGDQEMYSKFYDYKSSRKYEYIFVYSESESTMAGAINVKNHKRMKYTNNEKFLRNVFGLGSLDEAIEWKENTHIEVNTRTPMSVSINDIEKADVIIINNGDNMDYYKAAVKMYNIAHCATGDTAIANGISDVFDSSHDFSDASGDAAAGFEKVIKIYERVVVREDVAFIGSRNCINGTTFDTNMRKLMCMLFFVNKVEDGSEKPFAGRDIFMNYMRRYGDVPGTRYVDASKPAKESEPDYRYVNDVENPTYSTLRERYEAHKNSDDSKLYADFRAPSLRNNDYYTGKPYMHVKIEGIHVGHPLVLDPERAITGGEYVNGSLKPIYNASVAKSSQQETLARYDHSQYDDSGLHEKQSDDDDGYYSRIVRTEEARYKYDPAVYWYVQDPNGEYVNRNGNYVKETPRYTENTVWYYDNAYNSMCNATDFAYIDDTGKLNILDQYSSDKGPYWFKIDYDGGINGQYAYRRITWSSASYTSWPWSDGGVYMGKWVFAKNTNGNNANLHMYYDYIAWGPYRPGNVPSGNQAYRNQSLEEENALFKGDAKLIKQAVTGRNVKREIDDPRHVYDTVKKDYYISMNILNGDGVVKVPGLDTSKRNKTIYFNAYEESKLTNIPISIRIKSSCKITKIRVFSTGDPGFDITYSINVTPSETVSTITGTSGSGSVIKLERLPEIEETKSDKTPIYVYETPADPENDGRIQDVIKDYFINNRNTKVYVELEAEGPDKKLKTVRDEITIVKRDFFMLD